MHTTLQNIKLQKLKDSTEPKIETDQWIRTKYPNSPLINENFICDKDAISNLWRRHGSFNKLYCDN